MAVTIAPMRHQPLPVECFPAALAFFPGVHLLTCENFLAAARHLLTAHIRYRPAHAGHGAGQPKTNKVKYQSSNLKIRLRGHHAYKTCKAT